MTRLEAKDHSRFPSLSPCWTAQTAATFNNLPQLYYIFLCKIRIPLTIKIQFF